MFALLGVFLIGVGVALNTSASLGNDPVGILGNDSGAAWDGFQCGKILFDYFNSH